MENQNYETEEQHETVILILETKKFKVDKQKLINKSLYFAALLSTNYAECDQQEHVINYNIPLYTFKEFTYWISNDRMPVIEACSMDDVLTHFLILLEVAVLFTVDDLIKDTIENLEGGFFLPKYLIQIWLFAQELCINVLSDVCLAACLDRFYELPIDSILDLSKNNFLKLIGNINVRCAEPYLFDVARKWRQRNIHCKDVNFQDDFLKNKQPRILNCVITCKSLDIKDTFYLNCWDGKKFFELTTFKYPKSLIMHENTDTMLTGMQIAARGYQLYLVGGEFGIGSGIFNKALWRYSLISKTWFHVTEYAIARRHMVAAFISDNLYLVGGVGKFRRKLRSVDRYNINEGYWMSCAYLPFDFVTVPKYYVYNNSLVVYTDVYCMYIYYPHLDQWNKINCVTPIVSDVLSKMPYHKPNKPILVVKKAPCYLDEFQGNLVLRNITECDTEQCNTEKYAKINFNKLTQGGSEHGMDFFFALIKFYYSFGNSKMEVVTICLDVGSRPNLHVHEVPIQDSPKFYSLFYSHKFSEHFFNIFDLAHLHTVGNSNLINNYFSDRTTNISERNVKSCL